MHVLTPEQVSILSRMGIDDPDRNARKILKNFFYSFIALFEKYDIDRINQMAEYYESQDGDAYERVKRMVIVAPRWREKETSARTCYSINDGTNFILEHFK